ncbi:Hypothetical predicted protein [Paramuricea clavata]|uniref:Uncharacterized protein n=1 Tax=Paramuricea clavata TaxID=317549 RepID=A0A7D9IZS0_PARCT|nr:Hypothetical predicted protein [Paramuricea clavata]
MPVKDTIVKQRESFSKPQLQSIKASLRQEKRQRMEDMSQPMWKRSFGQQDAFFDAARDGEEERIRRPHQGSGVAGREEEDCYAEPKSEQVFRGLWLTNNLIIIGLCSRGKVLSADAISIVCELALVPNNLLTSTPLMLSAVVFVAQQPMVGLVLPLLEMSKKQTMQGNRNLLHCVNATSILRTGVCDNESFFFAFSEPSGLNTRFVVF